MVEINLLPWRQHIYARNRKRRKYFFLLLSGLLVMVFILIHVVFDWTIKKVDSNRLSLKNKLDQAERQPLLMEKSSAESSLSTLLKKMGLRQKKLSDSFKKIVKMHSYHIQIIKMNYTDKQVFLVGRAHSIYELSHWFRDLHVSRVKNFKVEQVRGTDLQQFYFVFE